MAQTLEISEARKRFNAMGERLREHPVIYVTRHNRPAFVVVSSDYFSVALETIEVLTDPEAQMMLEEVIADLCAAATTEKGAGRG